MKKNLLKVLTVSGLFLGGSVLFSCSSDDNSSIPTPKETGSEILSKHVWITTEVKDNKGKKMDLNTMPAAMYVGYAYYKPDGTFRIVDLKDQPKMYGEWTLSDNDSKRNLVVYKTDNSVAYKRTVDLVALNNSVFTYQIADGSNASVIYDVEHKPVTNHPEPKTPAEVLASVEWTTTKVLDITNGVEGAPEMDRTVAPASNFSGDAFYVNNNGSAYFPKTKDGVFANGTFAITAYGDKTEVRSQGDWYVSVDGKERVLTARDAEGKVAWTRAVPIVELSATKFTYDITISVNNIETTLRVEHEPIKK